MARKPLTADKRRDFVDRDVASVRLNDQAANRAMSRRYVTSLALEDHLNAEMADMRRDLEWLHQAHPFEFEWDEDRAPRTNHSPY